MLRPPLTLLVATLVVLLLASCQSADQPSKADRSPRPASSPAVDDPTINLASLTPYVAPEEVSTPEAPEGFEPVFAQNVARHGARSLTSDDAIEDAIELWDEAKAAGALTKAGRRFGPDARALRAAMDRVGFGDLSTLGKEEMQAIGKREGERLAAMFEKAKSENMKVDVFDSGRGRAEESAENFSIGLASVQPGLSIEPPEENERVLKFDNEDDAYEDFLDDGPWKPGYYAVRKLAKVDEAATGMLEHLYDEDFVATIDEPLAAADAIYDVWRSGPAMSRDVNVDSTSLVPREDAEAFSYVDDGRYFYSRGPGLEGVDGSYIAARTLLRAFFKAIDEHVNGRPGHEHVAVYRFAHAEELTPFAALLGITGADEQASKDDPYTHENNDFRVSKISPLSGNISWVVWQRNGTRIVSVEHNERPTTLGRGCETYEGTENFYALKELRRCLGPFLAKQATPTP